MTSNILLAKGSRLEGCMIVRLDNSDYVATFAEDAGNVTMQNSTLIGFAPGPWKWIKLWWQIIRPARKRQTIELSAGIYVPLALVK